MFGGQLNSGHSVARLSAPITIPARRRDRGLRISCCIPRCFPAELHQQSDAKTLAHTKQGLADFSRCIDVGACAAGHGTHDLNAGLRQFWALSDQDVTVVKYNNLAGDDDGAGFSAKAIANVIAIAGPRTDDLVRECRAAIWKRPFDPTAERASRVDVALSHEGIAVCGHVVLEHRSFVIDKARKVFGDIERW